MAKREKTSLSLDPELMKAVSHRCIDLDIEKSEAVEMALRLWLNPERSQAGSDGEFVKVPMNPPGLRSLVLEVIQVYSVPGKFEEDFVKNVVPGLGPVAVPPKKNTGK